MVVEKLDEILDRLRTLECKVDALFDCPDVTIFDKRLATLENKVLALEFPCERYLSPHHPA